MTDIEISKEDRDSRHRRYVDVSLVSRVRQRTRFTFRGIDLISADDVGAPETMRGTGTASALVGCMVEDARRNGFRIIQFCALCQGTELQTSRMARCDDGRAR